MTFIFRPVDEATISTFLSWHYEPPYDVYNLASPDETGIQFFLEAQQAYYSIFDEVGDDLVAFCCFGRDAQVPGGDYRAKALDIGLGVRPDLTGRGQGLRYVSAVLDFARQTFAPATFRVTVAAFNERALRVWAKVGFRPVQRFRKYGDGRMFVVLRRAG